MEISTLWIGLWIYLCIGLMGSIGLLNHTDNMNRKYEEGKQKGKMIRFLGRKGYIAFLLIATLFFWLPIILFPSKQS